MDMEFMDHYHRPYPGGVDIGQQPPQQPRQRPVFQNQAQHGQLQGQQPYPFWNHQLVAFYRQHQRAALMMGQGAMHGSKQTEPKPRLAKDEVELLEREFAKNQKPNSTTKRELAERMGVEVPRINNWFQNRRAKEKQLKKTAEFEAQQASQGESPESSSPSDQGQGVVDEFFGLNNQHQPLGLSTATFDEPERGSDDSDDAESEAQQVATGETQEPTGAEPLPVQQTTQSPASSDSDGFIQVQYEDANPALQYGNGVSELGPSPAIVANPFTSPQHAGGFHPPMQFPLSFGDPRLNHGLPMHELPVHQLDGLPVHETMLHDPEVANLFPNGDFFAVPAAPQFPSQLISEGAINSSIETPIHEEPAETPVKLESLSPTSMSASSPAPIDMRFKSPPPPADIASRRNKHRPAPLGIPSLRGGPHMAGPKTGIDVPRRNENASPMRRISSATGGLTGRIQKPFVNTGGPRSPFLIERNKEALFQQLQLQSPIMGTRGNAMSPETPEGMNNQCLRETTATSASDDDQNFGFGSLHTIGGFPIYKTESSIKTPPDTPSLAANFPEHFFPNSIEQAWSYVPHDEPLPTPSLCSHGGSELEFSMAPQMPGYVASQPATPSFPPSIGPTYGGFFGGNLANAEYNFPDSYPPECSARSSPAGPPKSKQFQFAQNVTPQDFNQEK